MEQLALSALRAFAQELVTVLAKSKKGSGSFTRPHSLAGGVAATLKKRQFGTGQKPARRQDRGIAVTVAAAFRNTRKLATITPVCKSVSGKKKT